MSLEGQFGALLKLEGQQLMESGWVFMGGLNLGEGFLK